MVSNLLLKLSRQLYTDDNDREQFIQSLLEPVPIHPAIVWCQDYQPKPFPCLEPLPWQPSFTDRLELHSRPGKHELHDQGYYYCLDSSSIFAATVLLGIATPIKTIFDLCASPGGKSIFAWRTFHPEMLYANEVIGKRSAALLANFKRCKINNWEVLRSDVAVLAQQYSGQGDLVIVDAPCSGQSLLAKNTKNDGCFHPTLINRNAQRQRRILAHAATIVSPGGYLAYMTCTYAPAENEDNVNWFLKKFSNFRAIGVNCLQDYQSHLTDIPCYRLMPQSKIGAGCFTVLLQKTADEAGRAKHGRGESTFILPELVKEGRSSNGISPISSV
ncbi:MAG: RsmB/NOP family class I SAM-dependent RNA methyltransferase [Cyanobacteria bacterium KgW148]|nr:RsmB/NOP family class I SAM-dependent RNA methyltransferase [Cyanobacteria bacterium KgW148]